MLLNNDKINFCKTEECKRNPTEITINTSNYDSNIMTCCKYAYIRIIVMQYKTEIEL